MLRLFLGRCDFWDTTFGCRSRTLISLREVFDFRLIKGLNVCAGRLKSRFGSIVFFGQKIDNLNLWGLKIYEPFTSPTTNTLRH